MTTPATDVPLSRTWLAAVEFAARDALGSACKPFLRTVYFHAAREWLATQALEQGLPATRMDSPREALELYIAGGARGGLLRSREDIEMHEHDRGAFSFLVHRCPYKPVCAALNESGLKTSELTCPRLGCLAGAVEALCGENAEWVLDEFQHHAACRGRLRCGAP